MPLEVGQRLGCRDALLSGERRDVVSRLAIFPLLPRRARLPAAAVPALLSTLAAAAAHGGLPGAGMEQGQGVKHMPRLATDAAPAWELITLPLQGQGVPRPPYRA